MNRRMVITLLGGAVVWPLAARAQPVTTIGYFSSQSAIWDAPRIAALRQSLAEAGYTEGTNLAIEYRWVARLQWPYYRTGPKPLRHQSCSHFRLKRMEGGGEIRFK
jgi:hypothetical protein